MSDTTLKRDKDDEGPASEVVNPDDDEFDDDLDNALFGDDDDAAETANADADAKAEVAPEKGWHVSLCLTLPDADCRHEYVGCIVLQQMGMMKAQKQRQKQKKLSRQVIRQLSGSSLKMLLGKKQRNAIGAGCGLSEIAGLHMEACSAVSY